MENIKIPYTQTKEDKMNEFKQACDEYEQWAKANMRSVILIPHNLDHLEQMMIDFNSMPLKQRMRSDDESVRLFGKTNKERYEEFKFILISKDAMSSDDSNWEKSTMLDSAPVDNTNLTYERSYTLSNG